jgi:hypothetical protein
VKQLASIIPLILKPRKTTNKKQTSYGMKHAFSTILRNYCKNHHSYITNGEFILAMIMAGYQPIREGTSPNCYFKADFFPDMKGAPQFAPTKYCEADWKKKMPNFYHFRKMMMVYKEGIFFTPSQTAEQIDWYNKEYARQALVPPPPYEVSHVPCMSPLPSSSHDAFHSMPSVSSAPFHNTTMRSQSS